MNSQHGKVDDLPKDPSSLNLPPAPNRESGDQQSSTPIIPKEEDPPDP